MGLNDIMRKVAEQHQQSTEASKAGTIEIKVGAKLIDIADKELTEDTIVFICSVHQRNRIIEALRIADKNARLNLKQRRNSMQRKRKLKRGGK